MVRSKRKANRGKLKKRKDCSFQEKIYGVGLVCIINQRVFDEGNNYLAALCSSDCVGVEKV